MSNNRPPQRLIGLTRHYGSTQSRLQTRTTQSHGLNTFKHYQKVDREMQFMCEYDAQNKSMAKGTLLSNCSRIDHYYSKPPRDSCTSLSFRQWLSFLRPCEIEELAQVTSHSRHRQEKESLRHSLQDVLQCSSFQLVFRQGDN